MPGRLQDKVALVTGAGCVGPGHPGGFMGDGRDTAHAALLLASDEARFVTGTEIIVDGGMVARCD